MDLELVIVVGGLAITTTCYARGLWLLAYVDSKLKQRGRLLLICGSGAQTVACVVTGSSVAAAVNAAVGAWFLYDWWNNGGGDGMKRRMKKMAGYLGFGPQAAPSVT